jgi:hypothetical protein
VLRAVKPGGEPAEAPRGKNRTGAVRRLVRPEGLEPPTCGFEGRRSIQMSYGRISGKQIRIVTRRSFENDAVSTATGVLPHPGEESAADGDPFA